VTTFGDVHISTNKSKFGGASIYFDGSGDYLSLPQHGGRDGNKNEGLDHRSFIL
jgi:hypothetical protein